MNRKLVTAVMSLALALPCGVALAQKPVQNVGNRHPNLEAAQRLCAQAFARLSASQQANEFDEGGHAAEAKRLLEQVNQQIKMAAEVDNHKR